MTNEKKRRSRGGRAARRSWPYKDRRIDFIRWLQRQYSAHLKKAGGRHG
jgi:hypothetical protein